MCSLIFNQKSAALLEFSKTIAELVLFNPTINRKKQEVSGIEFTNIVKIKTVWGLKYTLIIKNMLIPPEDLF